MVRNRSWHQLSIASEGLLIIYMYVSYCETKWVWGGDGVEELARGEAEDVVIYRYIGCTYSCMHIL